MRSQQAFTLHCTLLLSASFAQTGNKIATLFLKCSRLPKHSSVKHFTPQADFLPHADHRRQIRQLVLGINYSLLARSVSLRHSSGMHYHSKQGCDRYTKGQINGVWNQSRGELCCCPVSVKFRSVKLSRFPSSELFTFTFLLLSHHSHSRHLMPLYFPSILSRLLTCLKVSPGVGLCSLTALQLRSSMCFKVWFTVSSNTCRSCTALFPCWPLFTRWW